jgi:hypothetical protein
MGTYDVKSDFLNFGWMTPPRVAGSSTLYASLPAPITIIPYEPAITVAHVGVQDGAIRNYVGPVWTAPGLGGAPILTADASLGFFGGGSKQGMTSFNLNRYLYLPPNNVVDQLYNGNNWIMTWVFKLPSNSSFQWNPLPPTMFSMGNYRSTTEPGFAAFPRRTNYANNDGYAVFPKNFASSWAQSGQAPVETACGYIWTISNTNIGVGSVARIGNDLRMMIGSRNLGFSGLGSVSTVTPGPTTGTPTVGTYIGSNSNTSLNAPWGDGIVWEFRMVQYPGTVTAQVLSDLLWATLQF